MAIVREDSCYKSEVYKGNGITLRIQRSLERPSPLS